MSELSGEKNWFIDVIEEWSQFFRADNWFTFHPCWIEFEDDRIMGGYEVTVVILGLGFRWRWNHTQTDTMKYCSDAVKEIMSDSCCGAVGNEACMSYDQLGKDCNNG